MPDTYIEIVTLTGLDKTRNALAKTGDSFRPVAKTSGRISGITGFSFESAIDYSPPLKKNSASDHHQGYSV